MIGTASAVTRAPAKKRPAAKAPVSAWEDRIAAIVREAGAAASRRRSQSTFCGSLVSSVGPVTVLVSTGSSMSAAEATSSFR